MGEKWSFALRWAAFVVNFPFVFLLVIIFYLMDAMVVVTNSTLEILRYRWRV